MSDPLAVLRELVEAQDARNADEDVALAKADYADSDAALEAYVASEARLARAWDEARRAVA